MKRHSNKNGGQILYKFWFLIEKQKLIQNLAIKNITKPFVHIFGTIFCSNFPSSNGDKISKIQNSNFWQIFSSNESIFFYNFVAKRTKKNPR